jgi:hypothetical protein
MATKPERREREPITLDTPVPEKPKKEELIPEPSEAKFKAELDKIENLIKKTRDEKEAVKKQIDAKKQGGLVETTNESVKEFVNNRRNDAQEWIQERRRLIDEIKGLKRELALSFEEQNRIKPKIKFFDESKIEETITQLQHKHETTSLSLKEEKDLLAELKELEASKPLFKDFKQRSAKIEILKKKSDSLNPRIDELKKKIDEAFSVINETQTKSKESRDKLKEEIPTLIEERKTLDVKIKELEEKRNSVKDTYYTNKKAYEKQQRFIKQIDFIVKVKKQLEEKEERRKKWEERQKEDEENKEHPFARQIQLCENFIEYLEKLIKKDEEDKRLEERKNAQLVQEPGLVALPSKEERSAQQSILNNKKQKKQRNRKQLQPESALLNMPIELLNFLSSEALKVPNTIEEIKETVEAIKQKKANYESKTEADLPQEEQKAERRPKRTNEDSKTSGKVEFNPQDFPEPEEVKHKEEYGIFEDETSRPATTKPSNAPRRGGRGRRGRGTR